MKPAIILSFALVLALPFATALFAVGIGTGLQAPTISPPVINSGQSNITVPNQVPYMGSTQPVSPQVTAPVQPSITPQPVIPPGVPPTLTRPGGVGTPAMPGAGPIDGAGVNRRIVPGGTLSPNLNPGVLSTVPSVVQPPRTSTTPSTVP